MRKSRLKFWLFLSPAIISFFIVVVVPTFIGFLYSFTDWRGLGSNVNFVGFNNFINIFLEDKEYINALWFTVKVTFFSIILNNVIGISLALLVTQRFKGSHFIRSLFFMPNLIGGLLLGFVWRFIFTDIFFVLAKITGLGFFNGWLATTKTGFWGMVIVNTWQMSGYMMVIYISQLQQIPCYAKEAAKIDGTNAFQNFFNVTLPLIMPAFTVGLFLSIANSFKMFEQNLALTGGAPYHSTQMLALNIYNTAFSKSQFGLAQAKSIVFFIAVASVSILQLFLTKKREVEM